MMHPRYRQLLAGAAIGVLLAAPARAQQTQAPPTAPAPPSPEAAAPTSPAVPDLGLRVELEPKAIDLLKAMSAKLAAARTMTFDATAIYESPARTGEPLAYTTLSHVTLERPDRLRVITPGDGPPSAFYYDGKTITAFSPDEDVAAVAPAPPTIGAMLKVAFDKAAIYFPFTDMIVADPYGDIAEKLKLAFVMGKSHVVGGVETDIVVLADDTVQAQLWIGTDDHLPRMLRATFFDEPGNFRHVVEFSNWQLDAVIPPDSFASAQAMAAKRIAFAPPTPTPATPDAGSPKP